VAGLTITELRKSYGAVDILKGIDLRIEDGEFVSFLGPSGCGKSTLLRCIAGLEEMTTGSIELGERDISDVPSAKRDIAMVFQNYALYPHMNVKKNMAFGLSLNGMKSDEIEQRVSDAADILRTTDLLGRKPKQLSGGQRQRVAIGRAIVRKPKLFLLDEPLSNLDAGLRVTMRAELAALHERLGVTMVYVTHDQVEAMTLSSRVVVLDKGRVSQFGAPLELFHRPANLFVAGFIGSPRMNFLPATVVSQGENDVTLVTQQMNGALTVRVAGQRSLAVGEPLTLGIRPDQLRIVAVGVGHLTGTIRLMERLGTESHAHVALEDGTALVVITDGGHPGRAHDRIGLMIRPDAAHAFTADGIALPRQLDAETRQLIQHG
jgi:multiple sugar transport system ATP-binding protein